MHGKKITVVIDAGHGGSDNGATENNINEKDLNLAIAKDIKELNRNDNINIILIKR
jgi:N-acetylmuramoyl-L-alanine amidase